MNKLHALEAYCLACEKQSFAAAARELGISAAMVGRYIKQLEEELGCLLVMRNTRKVSITEAGENYYKQISPILKKLHAVDQAMSEYNQEPKGRLSISTSVELGSQYFSGLIANYRELYPQVFLDFHLSNDPLDLLDNKIDLVFRIAPELPDSSYIVQSIAKTKLALWASDSYVEENGQPESLEALKKHQLLFFNHSIRGDHWLFLDKEEIKKIKLPWAWQSNNGRLLNEAAAEGQGIIQAPFYSVKSYVESGQLIEILPEFTIKPLTVFALYPHRCELSLKVKTFIDMAKSYFAKHHSEQF
ncbi:LysR substrate-binding domain-containing protein [Microbulbifer sp. VTAC004]|uniref:LysR substrate-binding domain-containing protein n=1 Tax=Microbulbifer sp. VTAC004 TaxID=3243386 RepID=UPI00403A1364